MSGALRLLENGILIFNFEDFIILPLTLVLLFMSLQICYRKFKRANRSTQEQQCPNKYCIRCRRKSFGKDKLLTRLNDFRANENIDDNKLIRLRKSINTNDGLKRHLTNAVSWENNKQRPTVLHLQDLEPSTPLHDINNSDVEILKSSKIFDSVQEELLDVIVEDSLWEQNDVPMGSWKLFYFFNQGKMLTENCRHCPKTTDAILQIASFMKSSSFGNAAFSILFPGSKISTHCGATNARLRCHLTLLAGSGCTLTVGSENVVYETGKLILFDDSFPHSVSYDSNDQDIRAVLLIDLWHPAVTDIERHAIEKIYSI